jgi:hypothetical protein
MNVALATCALMLGGWSMPASDDWSPPSEGDVKIQVDQPLSLDDAPAAPQAEQPRARSPVDARLSRRALANQSNARRALRPQVMPLSPKDPMVGMSQDDAMPQAPTFPTSPTAGGGASHGYVPFSGQHGARPYGAAGFGTRTSAYPSTVTSGERPFANYRLPQPVSPYMNMYRAGTDNGTIDNYTTLVRPQLEQNSYNATNTTEVNSVQNNVQQLNQQMPAQQGAVAPQYFINYRDYYPNGGAGGSSGSSGGYGGGR